jgi:enoyl-[acyl-carrier-protein] reductase (NADH)
LIRPEPYCAFVSGHNANFTVGRDRIERVFAGRAQISGKSMTEVRADAMAEQSIKEMIEPKDIAALAVFLASDAGKSISGQVLPIDNDRQRA